MQTITRRGLGPLVVLSIVLCLLGVSLGGCGGRVSDTSIRPVALSDAASRLEKRPEGTLVMDARSLDAFNAGHIPGARHTRLADVDLTSREPRFGAWDQIIVYGDNRGSGNARALVKRLLQTGHKNVFLLEAGFDGWSAAGMAVRTGG